MIEDIKDRIHKLIDSEQLTSSKFAEMIGVQRATISHVINGRNLPSLDLVRKILITFSTLNSEWLIFGRGPMYKDSKNKQLFDEDESETKKETSEKEPVKEELEAEDKSESLKNEKPTEEESEKSEQLIEEKNSDPEDRHPIKEPAEKNSDKNISSTEKIIIFNSDRTFVEYSPK
jgi:transcriptional regulator with XRE-family HTH domain